MGVESGSPSQLIRYGKGVTVEETEQAIRILREIGFNVEPGFIFFDPEATLDELKESIDFIKRTELAKTKSRLFGSLRVQAGSKIEARYRLEHIISDDDFNLNNLSYSINKNKYRDAEVAAMETAFASGEPQARAILKILYAIIYIQEKI